MPELKKLLEKAEADLESHKHRVKALESIITDLGGSLPKEEEFEALEERQRDLESEVEQLNSQIEQ